MKRIAIITLVVLVTAAALFLVPTIWFKPWSIDHFYARVFLQYVLERPMLLSQLRILEQYGIESHNDDLDDFSVARTEREAQEVADNLATLRSYDQAALSPSQRLSRDVLEWFLDDLNRRRPFRFHDYPVNHVFGLQSGLADFMINVHQVRDEGDAEDFITRLSKLATALDQLAAGMRHRAALGIAPPRFVYDRVIADTGAFLKPKPEENEIFRGFSRSLDKLAELPDASKSSLRESCRAAVADVVYPAYRSLIAEVERQRAAAGSEDGVWHLPDGAAYYAYRLRSHTTTELTPDAVHELGKREVERIQQELRKILEGQGIVSQNLNDTLQQLNSDPRFLYPGTDEGRKQALADYQHIVDDMSGHLAELFRVLPAAPVTVERMPAFKESSAPGAYYNPPPLDGSKPGIFYANLGKMGDVPKFGMRTLAYHEAVPGHHLQIAIAQELRDVAFFRRLVPFTAYSEGWALYAERLADEQGFFKDPFDRLGYLVSQAFRAVRLVVDTGIHAHAWTREQAIEYMVANTGMPRGDVVREIERYIVTPGQACAYKIGELKIVELRERARQALGDRFELRRFHQAVLGNGALPLALLEREVDAWIASAGGAPAAGGS